MRNSFISLAFICAFVLLKPLASTATITIDTVPIGNPGNAADPSVGVYGDSGFGSVGYNYSIGKYDVTVGQYTAFLNAVAATDTYGLYNTSMATDLNIAGIAQHGSSGSYTYSVIGSANHPIVDVGFFEAARFANWLNNGQPTGGQTLSTTEDGAYFLNGATATDFVALQNVTRKAGAQWFIPTENEWYKAAYYNPASNTYYQYPFSSNTPPTSAHPGNTPNTTNFLDSTTGYAITGSTSDDPGQNYLTDVGAYTSSVSPYGAFDMGGNVFQWNEGLNGGNGGRSIRGGSWDWGSAEGQSAYYLNSDFRGFSLGAGSLLGFRVATVPEPPSFILLAMASAGLLWRARRYR